MRLVSLRKRQDVRSIRLALRSSKSGRLARAGLLIAAGIAELLLPRPDRRSGGDRRAEVRPLSSAAQAYSGRCQFGRRRT